MEKISAFFCDNCVQKIKKISPAQIKLFVMVMQFFQKLKKVSPSFSTGVTFSQESEKSVIKFYQF